MVQIPAGLIWAVDMSMKGRKMPTGEETISKFDNQDSILNICTAGLWAGSVE